MIPNPHKFMVTAIDMFYRQSKIANKPSDPYTLGFDPSRFYTNGHCAEFAYVLADFAAKKGLEPSMTIMFRNRINAKSGEAIEKILSHCIVEMDGQAYDICGDDARMTWFVKSGYMNQDNNEERSEWEFVSIPLQIEKMLLSSYKSIARGIMFHSLATRLKKIKRSSTH